MHARFAGVLAPNRPTGDPRAAPVPFAGLGVLAAAVWGGIQERFQPAVGERLVQKQVPDAFCATGLEASLREAGIEQLIIVGVATNNSVESTARTAGNLGFEAWVAEDACFTFDKADYFGNAHSAEEVHAMSLGNLHGEYATVISTAQILI